MPATEVPLPLISIESIPALSSNLQIVRDSDSFKPPRIKSLLLILIVICKSGADSRIPRKISRIILARFSVFPPYESIL